MWMGHHMKTSLDHSGLILKLSNHFQWRLHSAQPFSNFTAHYHITVTPQLPNLKATAPPCKFCQLNLSLLSSLACQHITTARRCQQNCFGTLSASAIWSAKRSHDQKTSLKMVIFCWLYTHVSWAIALHGKVTHHWLQVTCVSHCFICQSKNVGKYL